jgi:TetR/AcrR family transcriptional repressor of mexJK operon
MSKTNLKLRGSVGAAVQRIRPVKPVVPSNGNNRAGRPTSAELERRKARVMEVATALFVQHGYAATSLVDIAKAAGVATRTLYQHFGDKESIFLDVMTARETGAVFPQPSVDEATTAFEALMLIARYTCDVSFRPRSVDLMRLMIAESKRFPDFMKKLCRKTFSRFKANVAEMFDELAARKITASTDSAKSASLFVDLILGSTPLFVYAGWSSSRPTDEELQAKVELFIRGRFSPAAAKKAMSAVSSDAVAERE